MAGAALIRASGNTLVTTAAITGVSFFSSVVTARLLGPEGRGLLSAALLVCTLSAGIAQLGLANSFVYHRGTGGVFAYRRLFFWSVLFVGTASGCIAYASLGLSSEPRLHEHVLLIVCTAVFMGSQTYFSTLSMVQADLRFFNIMRLSLVVGNFMLLLAVLAVMTGIGYEHVLATQLAVVAVLTLAGLWWAGKHAVWTSGAPAGAPVPCSQVLAYGAHHHGTVLLGLLLINFDKVTLLAIGSMAQYGFYAVAFATSRLIGAVQEAVSTALYARFAGKDVAALSHNVKVAFRITFVPMLVVAAAGAAVSPWLIVLVYGDAYAPMTAPFAILLFECVITGGAWTLAQRFNAGGRPGVVLVRQLISVLPILIAVPFLPASNLPLHLSLLMLCGAILRLIVTAVLYPVTLKESIPRFTPTCEDCAAALALLRRRTRVSSERP